MRVTKRQKTFEIKCLRSMTVVTGSNMIMNKEILRRTGIKKEWHGGLMAAYLLYLVT